jgi:hypothetical protein
MTSRTPADDDLLLEATDALETTDAAVGADGGLAARLAGAAPSLQAEVKALQAVKALLRHDEAWGKSSGTDAPPAHLLDAILRAEVAARPDAIRQAVALAIDPPVPAATRLWAKLSSWLLGGGVVVGTAAAILITIQRAPGEALAPAAAQSAATTMAAPTVAAKTMAAKTMAAPTLAAPTLAGAVEADGSSLGPVKKMATALTEASEAPAASDQAMPAENAERAERAGGSGGGGGLAVGAMVAKSAMASPDGRMDALNDLDEAPAKQASPAARREAGWGVVEGQDEGSLAGATRAGAKADRMADRVADDMADDMADEAPARMGVSAAKPAPSLSPPPPPASPPMATAPAPRIISAEEARRSFMLQREQAKERARASKDGEPAPAGARGRATNEAESKAKAEAPPKGAAGKNADKKSAAEARDSAGEAREQMARQRQLQEANSLLLTAERELSIRRYDSAVDLARRAETIAGGGLGLGPASTLVRALLGLKRFAEATTVAARLLQGPAADPQVVDGMMAGAQAAQQVGDQRLAQRLLERAASADNTDVSRRQQAQQALKALKALRNTGTGAPAKRAAEAEAAAPSDTP